MKRLLLIFATIALVGCGAKESAKNGDYKFLGIPINQPTELFAQQLKAKGFVADGDKYEGEMYMHKCIVEHSAEDYNGHKMYNVWAETLPEWEWPLLEFEYTTIKDYLIEEYGEPTSISEDWDKIANLSHADKLSQSINGEITFQATWENFADDSQTVGQGMALLITRRCVQLQIYCSE